METNLTNWQTSLSGVPRQASLCLEYQHPHHCLPKHNGAICHSWLISSGDEVSMRYEATVSITQYIALLLMFIHI